MVPMQTVQKATLNRCVVLIQEELLFPSILQGKKGQIKSKKISN